MFLVLFVLLRIFSSCDSCVLFICFFFFLHFSFRDIFLCVLFGYVFFFSMHFLCFVSSSLRFIYNSSSEGFKFCFFDICLCCCSAVINVFFLIYWVFVDFFFRSSLLVVSYRCVSQHFTIVMSIISSTFRNLMSFFQKIFNRFKVVTSELSRV